MKHLLHHLRLVLRVPGLLLHGVALLHGRRRGVARLRRAILRLVCAFGGIVRRAEHA